MNELDYSPSGVTVRDDIRDAHRALWVHVGSAGTWWTGAERVAIAAESRRAATCAFCRERRAALSPNAVQGAHQSLSVLSPPLVDVIHRVRTDAGRLTRAWYESLADRGLGDAQYVELVAVVTMVAGVDFFARALGVPPFPLPEPVRGEPARRRPAGARTDTAWVPT